MNRCRSSIKKAAGFFLLLFTAMLIGVSPFRVKAAESAEAVDIVSISYDEGYITLDPNGNGKVYFSETGEDKWFEVEGKADASGFVKLDISWISDKKDYPISFKGDLNEDEVDIVLPKANTSLKVKYDKVDGVLNFTNEDGAEYFQWKKATSFNWETQVSLNNQSSFVEEMETLRIKGGKITIRIPGRGGDASDPGERPSKSMTVSISKRATAPSIKLDVNRLTLNTTDKMEYYVYSIGGVIAPEAWEPCSKKMLLEDIAKDVFADTEAGDVVVIAVRKTATERAGYSKTTYFTVPAQLTAPAEPVTTQTVDKFTFSVLDASSTKVYQYAVVEMGDTISDDSELKWRTLSSSKPASFSKRSYPDGSTVYLRVKGVSQTSKKALVLPSAYSTFSIEYLEETPAEPTAAPAPTTAP